MLCIKLYFICYYCEVEKHKLAELHDLFGAAAQQLPKGWVLSPVDENHTCPSCAEEKGISE